MSQLYLIFAAGSILMVVILLCSCNIPTMTPPQFWRSCLLVVHRKILLSSSRISFLTWTSHSKLTSPGEPVCWGSITSRNQFVAIVVFKVLISSFLWWFSLAGLWWHFFFFLLIVWYFVGYWKLKRWNFASIIKIEAFQ